MTTIILMVSRPTVATCYAFTIITHKIFALKYIDIKIESLLQYVFRKLFKMLDSQVPSAYPAMFGIQHEAKLLCEIVTKSLKIFINIQRRLDFH